MLEDNEVWIEGYELRYSITTEGRLFSHIRGKKEIALNAGFSNKRQQYMYRTCNLSVKGGKQKMFYIHRLVAVTFIPNPENKPAVNHKDLNKVNNSVENLEWVTNSENSMHAVENIVKTDKEDAVLKEAERKELVDNFIKTGHTAGYCLETLYNAVTESDLEYHDIPGCFIHSLWKEGSVLKSWIHCIDLFNCIDQGLSLSKISYKLGISESSISRARSGKILVNARLAYNIAKQNPKYEKWFK